MSIKMMLYFKILGLVQTCSPLSSFGLRVRPIFWPLGGVRVSTPRANLLNESLKKCLSSEGKLKMCDRRVSKGPVNEVNTYDLARIFPKIYLKMSLVIQKQKINTANWNVFHYKQMLCTAITMHSQKGSIKCPLCICIHC